jgi:hypothetical protein
MSSKVKIKALHSFPAHEKKFKEYCNLTFQLEQLNNTFVDSLADLKRDITDFDLIFIHYLRREDIQFLNYNDLSIPAIWFAWGGEFYNQLGRFYNKTVLGKTKRLRDTLLTRAPSGNMIKTFIKSRFPFFLDYWSTKRQKIRAINSFDYIVPVMPGDYVLLKNYYGVEPRLHHLNYINPLMEKDDIPVTDGQNILLGNSASFTNNHVEAIDQLSKIKIDERKVIIPLSYGREDLANYISEYAKNKLGESSVSILKEFLSFEEYNKIINSCEIVVMNHIRQQAVGNIVQALLQGSHIYLRPESTVYTYMIENDVKVSNFEKAERFVPLQKKDKIFNRKRTKKVFGAKRQRDRLEQLINKVVK